MPLSFLDELDDAQVDAANKIAKKAKQLGVDPKLAVALAYAESKLRINTDDSPKKAIGVMQITPDTGLDMKLSEEDLRNPDVNIDAGVRILKKHLNKYPDDPRLALVAYNAGPGSNFFSGGELPEETKDYIKKIIGYGGIPAPAVDQTPAMTEEDVVPEETVPEEESSGFSDKSLAQGAGAVVGYKVGQLQNRVPSMPAQGGALDAAMPAGAPVEAAPTGRPAMPGSAPAAPQMGGARPAGGSATANWGKAFGLGDIEANRATGMGNMPGSADELIKARADALKRLQGMAPAAGMAEDPTRGGLMVPQQTPYTGPRGPQGEIGGAKPPPVSPVTSKPAGALEEVVNLFRQMTRAPLLRRAIPIVGGALSGGEALRAAEELRKDNPDLGEAALSGAGALGGVMSMFPATAPVGIPLSVGVGAARFAQDRARENERLGYKPDVIPSNPMGDFGF
jgi:Transglycosylase SLT domain